MEDRDFTLGSGAKLWISLAPFADAKRLHDKLLQALVGRGVGNIDLKAFQDPDKAGSAVMDALMQVASNKEVEDAIFDCAKRALYSHDGSEASRSKVDRTLFDDPAAGEKAREDFYPICFKVIEVNLKPFLQAIFSVLKAQSGMIAGIQASISKQTKQPQ